MFAGLVRLSRRRLCFVCGLGPLITQEAMLYSMIEVAQIRNLSEGLPLFGEFSEGFEPVFDAFVSNFIDLDDFGASVCIYHQGRKVVDLTGGWSSKRSEINYSQDLVQMVFSSTKGACTICALKLIEEGLLDPQSPVSHYWPEFAPNNSLKSTTTVEHLLTHQAGLAVIDEKLTLEELLSWHPIIRALEIQEPSWEPGCAHGYHALTFGWLVGEVIFRITGLSIGEYFSENIAKPLGLDFWIGLPPQFESLVSPLRIGPMPSMESVDPKLLAMVGEFLSPDSRLVKALTLNGAFGQFMGGKGPFNLPEVHQAQIPAANGITNARSLAKMYAACIGPVDGVQLLESSTLRDAVVVRSNGKDEILPTNSRFGLGFMLHDDEFMPMLGSGSFGHSGAGGSLGFGDLDNEIGFGYVMNQMRLSLASDPRQMNLIEALRKCLD